MAPGSSGRPGAYPLMLNTTNHDNAGRNRASSASPNNGAIDRSRFPPAPLEAGKSQSLSSKRPANSPINPSVDKRPRINGTPEQSRSAAAVSPAASRQNSTVGPVGAPSSRRASAVMSPGESVINPLRDPRKQGRGPADSASPMHVASPLSMTNGDAGQHDSGNTTPVHGAPFAPSMVPSTVPFPLKRPSDNGSPRSVASIRQAATKKQTLAAVSSETSALALIRAKHIELQNQVKNDKQVLDQVELELRNEKTQLNQLKTELSIEKTRRSELEDRLRRLEEKFKQPQKVPADSILAKELGTLSGKVGQLEALRQDPLKDEMSVNALVDRVMQSVRSEAKAVFDSELAVHLEQSLKPERRNIAAIQSEIEKRVKWVETNVETQNSKIAGLLKGPNPVETRLQKSLESDIEALDTRVSDLVEDFDERVRQAIKTDMNVLQNRVKEISTRTNSHKTRIDDLDVEKDTIEKNTDSNKTRIDELTSKLDSLTHSMETLMKENLSKQLADLETEFSTFKEVNNSTLTKKSVDTLIEKVNAANQYLDTLKDEDLPKQLADLKTEFISQKQSDYKRFTDVYGKLSALEKTMPEQSELLATQLEAVRKQMTADLDDHVDQMNKSVNEKLNNPLHEMTKSAQKVKDDIAKDIAKICEGAEENKNYAQTSLNDLKSSISTLADELRRELEEAQSAISGDLEQLRDRIRDLDFTEDISNVRLESLQHKSDIAQVQTQVVKLQLATSAVLDRSRTPVERSSVTPGATTALAQDATAQLQLSNVQNQILDKLKNEFRGQINNLFKEVEELSKEVDTARQTADGAKSLATYVGENLLGEIEGKYGPQFAAIEGDVKALQADVKTTREQPSLEHQLENTRQRTTALENQHEMVTRALQNIENRMQNMTTDELYQQIVHWITQTYPNAQGFLHNLNNLHNEINLIKGELHKIGTFTNEIGWMRGEGRATQLMSLANNWEAIIRSTERQSFDSDSIRDLIAKGEALSRDIERLRAELNSERDSRESLANGLPPVYNGMRNSIGDLERRMGHVECEIRELIISKADLGPRVEAAQSTIEQHGRTLEAQQHLSRQAMSNLSALNVAAHEHQVAILDVNKRMRGGGLKINFSQDFSKLRQS